MDLDKIWSIVGHEKGKAQNRTKCPYHRARTLYNCCENIIENNIEGDFLEAGCWKGGMSGLMGVLAEQENNNRIVHVFDSFKGMSEPDPRYDMRITESIAHDCYLPQVQLKNFDLNDFNKTCFNMLKLKKNTFNIVAGWVNETIPHNINTINKLAVLRIDLDWYEPTKDILNAFYPKLVTGGYIILDDYGHFKGCRKAVDDYRKEHNITTPLIQTPQDDNTPQINMLVGTEHYWKKE